MTTFCAKWGNDLRTYLSRAFWILRELGSRAVLGVWNVQVYAKACDNFDLGRVGLRLLIGRWARASSKQTVVGWSTAGSYLPILVLKCDFSSIAELHGLNHWLAHNRAFRYFGFIDIFGNLELGRRLRRRATRRVKKKTTHNRSSIYDYTVSTFTFLNLGVFNEQCGCCLIAPIFQE